MILVGARVRGQDGIGSLFVGAMWWVHLSRVQDIHAQCGDGDAGWVRLT